MPPEREGLSDVENLREFRIRIAEQMRQGQISELSGTEAKRVIEDLKKAQRANERIASRGPFDFGPLLRRNLETIWIMVRLRIQIAWNYIG